MAKYISILRGINVGGKRKILMKDLKALFEQLECSNVETYIQSGNVIFDSKQTNHKKLEDKIELAITLAYGFDVPVMVRSAEAWHAIYKNNPYSKEDINKLHIVFLNGGPSEEQSTSIDAIKYLPDLFSINSSHIYLCCNGNYRDTKLTNKLFEKKLGIKATTRNWKTFLALLKRLDNSDIS